MDDIVKLCATCTAKEKCISTLQSNAKQIFASLDKYTQPRRVCTTLGVCNASILTTTSKFVSISDASRTGLLNAVQNIQPGLTNTIVQRSNGTFCYECQMTMHFFQTLLFNPQVEDAIISTIKTNICEPIPSKIERKACDDYFNKYGKQMIQHFAMQFFDQKRVCVQQTRFCPSV